MKKYITVLFILLISFTAIAQVNVHTDMRTPIWNLISLKYDKQIKPLVWQAVFPPALKAVNNKIIELPGFIIPTKVGNSFTEFMFSIVPVASCPYCGSGDIPSMIEVKTLKAVVWTEEPITLRGRFVINDSGDGRSAFFLLDAVKQ